MVSGETKEAVELPAQFKDYLPQMSVMSRAAAVLKRGRAVEHWEPPHRNSIVCGPEQPPEVRLSPQRVWGLGGSRHAHMSAGRSCVDV